MKNKLFAILLVVLVGCSLEVETKSQLEWPQTCEMCGSKWLVTPIESKSVPPTVEWCFNDGKYCEKGLGMLTEAYKSGKIDDRLWLIHCVECEGCKHASFEPHEWHEIMDSIKISNTK